MIKKRTFRRRLSRREARFCFTYAKTAKRSEIKKTDGLSLTSARGSRNIENVFETGERQLKNSEKCSIMLNIVFYSRKTRMKYVGNRNGRGKYGPKTVNGEV